MKQILIIIGLSFVLSVNNPNPISSFKNNELSYYDMVLDKFYNAGESIKQHVNGLVLLVNLCYSIYKGKPIPKPLAEVEDEAEPFSRFDFDEGRIDDAATYYGEETKSAELNACYSQKKRIYIYYPYKVTSQAEFTKLLEDKIYYPANIYRCFNGPKDPREVTYVSYKCNGQIVTKKNYESLSNDPQNHCEKSTKLGKVCSCPRDLYDENCETRIPSYCGYRWIKPSTEELFCNKSKYNDIGYYDNSRSGFPPCYYIGESRKVTFEIALDCRLHRLGTEGVKTIQDYLAEPFVVNETFKYWLNTPNLALTEEMTVSVTLTFLNFKHVTDVEQFIYVARSKEEVSGEKSIKFTVDFDKLVNLRFGGRWYFELVANGQTSSHMTGYVMRGVMEDALYKEPEKPIPWLIIILMVVGSVAVVAFIAIRVKYYLRERQKEREFMAS